MEDFDQTVRAHTEAVQAFARSLSGDAWLVEEAVHLTFLRAWKYRYTFDGAGSYEGWLMRICRNVTCDLAKKRPDDQPLETFAELGCAEEMGEAEISDLIDMLPHVQRDVVMLCGVMGYDYESAAELLHVPVGTVRSRLHRGRAALTVALADAELVAA